jgi:hypothetical protein
LGVEGNKLLGQRLINAGFAHDSGLLNPLLGNWQESPDRWAELANKPAEYQADGECNQYCS